MRCCWLSMSSSSPPPASPRWHLITDIPANPTVRLVSSSACGGTGRTLRRHCSICRQHESIDGARLGLWGTSLGALHELQAAALEPDLAAVVVQCPIVHGPGTLRRSGLRPIFRLTPAIVLDALHRICGAGRTYVPIVGPPGTLAAVTIPGAGGLVFHRSVRLPVR